MTFRAESARLVAQATQGGTAEVVELIESDVVSVGLVGL